MLLSMTNVLFNNRVMKKMKRYETTEQVIANLHAKGFVYDFRYDGRNIVWVQEKLNIQENAYAVLERYDFTATGDKSGLSILAIAALDYTVKGILIDHSAKRKIINKNKTGL